jgi:hypothetical protein
MTESVQGGGAEQTIRKGLTPPCKIQVADHDERGPLITFGDQVVEVLTSFRPGAEYRNPADCRQAVPAQHHDEFEANSICCRGIAARHIRENPPDRQRQ